MAMKSSKISLINLVALICISIVLLATPTVEEANINFRNQNHDEHPSMVEAKRPEKPVYLRGTGRFLAQHARDATTCDRSPRVCRGKGSAGPNCCSKQCVDVKTDKLNCGKCGKKCKYSEICCKGKCVNPSQDEKHCGQCNNNCGKGNSCVYGLCSYA